MVYVQCVYDHIESAMPYCSRSLLSRDQRAKASAASNQHHVRFLHLASSDAIRSVATIICKHYLRNRQNTLSSRVVNLCTCSLDQWLLKREQVGTAFPNLKCVHKPFFLEKPLAWMVIISQMTQTLIRKLVRILRIGYWRSLQVICCGSNTEWMLSEPLLVTFRPIMLHSVMWKKFGDSEWVIHCVWPYFCMSRVQLQ